MTTLRINFAESRPPGYEVVVGPGLLKELGRRLAAIQVGPVRQAFLLADDKLPSALIDSAVASIKEAGFAVSLATAHASESDKSLAAYSSLMARLAATRHERRDPVIALGGGIVGDLAGFIAATYRRGVPVIQCPTTLLSMVDASVGGKTGVNIDAGGSLRKNMVGAFWQPALVLADTDVLTTLPERHLRAGLGECLKHGMISHATDPGLLDWTLDHLDAVMHHRAEVLSELVARNIRVKASFVEGDEREEKPSAQGGRALLNLGHTFAHAIETIPGLSPTGLPEHEPLHHGEAVALGLVAAAYTASAMDRLPWFVAEQVRRAVEAAGLPTKIAGLPGEESMIGLMLHDKKVAGGRLRLVLPVESNRAEVVDDPPFPAVQTGLSAIMA